MSVSPVKDGLQLPFKSNFADKANDWTWYNENATQFTKWTVEDGKAVVSRTEDDAYNYFEGLLVTPKLALTPGKTVRVDVAYAVDTDDKSLTLQLYGGTVNNPADMKPLAELPAKDGNYTFEFTPSEGETEYYLGFRSNTNHDDQEQYIYGPFYRIELSSVSVAYANATGIDDAASAHCVTVARRNGSITVSAAGGIVDASLYDATGRTIASAKGRGGSVSLGCGGYKGVAVLKATTASGAAVVRKLTL